MTTLPYIMVHNTRLYQQRDCRFSYRIIDFADEWIYNENNPNIVITKLPPGKYKLEVKCTNGDRVWSNQIYSLHLDVAYPWWLSTTAFIILFYFNCYCYLYNTVCHQESYPTESPDFTRTILKSKINNVFMIEVELLYERGT